jgi:hypothetical protein
MAGGGDNVERKRQNVISDTVEFVVGVNIADAKTTRGVGVNNRKKFG